MSLRKGNARADCRKPGHEGAQDRSRMVMILFAYTEVPFLQQGSCLGSDPRPPGERGAR